MRAANLLVEEPYALMRARTDLWEPWRVIARATRPAGTAGTGGPLMLAVVPEAIRQPTALTTVRAAPGRRVRLLVRQVERHSPRQQSLDGQPHQAADRHLLSGLERAQTGPGLEGVEQGGGGGGSLAPS